MASGGFGGLGGLGGYSPAFPTRIGAPNSQRVDSDAEFAGDWAERLAGIPRVMRDNYTVQAAANRPDTDPLTASGMFMTQYGLNNPGYWSLPESVRSMAEQNGIILSQDSSGNWTTGVSAYGPAASGQGSHTITREGVEYENPQYQAMLDRFKREKEQRSENAIRQQQGYETMLGGNQMNAVPGADYSNANFGSITGQQPAQIPGIGGVNMDWASGVYDPNQASGMFGNSGRPRGGWL